MMMDTNSDPEISWSQDITEESNVEPALPCCPKCSTPFDGWDCKACEYALPEKDRKMHPKIVSPEEVERFLKELDLLE